MSSALYVTTDRYLASFLCFKGAALDGWKRLGPKKVEFRFIACRDLHDLLCFYWSGHLTPVVPSELFAVHQRLKNMSIVRG